MASEKQMYKCLSCKFILWLEDLVSGKCPNCGDTPVKR